VDLTHIRFEGTHTDRVSLGPRALGRNPSLARRRSPARDEPVASGLPAHILAQHGLDPARYRHRPLERRIGACLRALRVSSEVAAWERVESDRAAQAIALNTLLIGVSSFFRDAAVFDVVRTTVVDALKRLGRPPRVWSVGCSTGAELYSVAMILEQEGLLDGAKLLGTDCRANAISSARKGVFELDHVANLDRATRDRYFERTHATWRIASSLRNHTRWQISDATRVRPLGMWDLVLCRNLVIYLHEPAGRALLRGIASALAPGGFLVVGRAERPPENRGLRAVGTCIYQNNVIA
jgi:chemotaxis protein methyltransferase CheR